MEVSLEKIVLTLVGLSFASMICVPLIEGSMMQVHDRYAYSQYETLINSLDNGIGIVINSTDQKQFQEEIYVPSTVIMNSSANRVTYHFNSDSITTTTNKEYPLNVNLSFRDTAGWYRVNIRLENSALITITFSRMTSG